MGTWEPLYALDIQLHGVKHRSVNCPLERLVFSPKPVLNFEWFPFCGMVVLVTMADIVTHYGLNAGLFSPLEPLRRLTFLQQLLM